MLKTTTKEMKMTKTNPWISLNTSVNSKRCSAEHKFDFFWAIDKNSAYLLAIELRNLENWSAKKLSLSGIEIEQYQITDGYRLVLKLHDNFDWDLFLNLCNDLLLATSECETEKAMLAIVNNRLQRWQKLFRKMGRKLLSAEEQQGLVGELYFIKNYLLLKYQETEIFAFWRGPYGEQQDFGIGNIAIEVKTKRGTSVPYVQISSVDQLDCKNAQCFLYVLTLNASPGSITKAFSLNDLVTEIKKKIESTEVLDLFESLLSEAGYIEIPEYSETSYLVSQETVYEVRDSFPRLTANSLPYGIHSVQYSIELLSCKPYEITLIDFSTRILNEPTD